MIAFIIIIFIIFLCWGSFLNLVAYRLIHDKSIFTKRSVCPSCQNIIRWYDNIPIISYILLRGKCRSCKSEISFLYPFIEALSGLIFSILFWTLYISNGGTSTGGTSTGGTFNFSFFNSFITMFIFFTCLIISTRTDLQALVIPQAFTLWVVPLAFFSSFTGATGIRPFDSMLGAFLGYFVLWFIGFVFKKIKKIDGIGVGDMELLAMIGSFLGPLGVWFTILIGSIFGLLIGGAYLIFTKQSRYTRIPFGPFLALGATIYYFFRNYLLLFLLG